MRDVYKLIQVVWPYVGPPLGFLALLGGLRLGIADLPLKAVQYVAHVNVGWLLFAGFCFFTTYTSFRHRGIPLTAVSTDIELVMESPSGDRVRVNRTERLRANRDDVTGYIKKMWSEGDINPSDVICSVDHCEADKQMKYAEVDARGLELIHRFPAIPRNILVLNTNTISRSETLVYTNAFTKDEESYEINMPPRYRHKRLKLTILFHRDRQCRLEDCKAIRINAHSVIDVPLAHVPATQGGSGVRMTIRHVHEGDRYRIYWKYPLVTASSQSHA